MTLLLYTTRSNEQQGSNTHFKGAPVTAIEVDAIVRAYNAFLKKNPLAKEKWGGCGGATFPGPEHSLKEIIMQNGSTRFSMAMRYQHYNSLIKTFPSVKDLDPKSYYAKLNARMGSKTLKENVRDLSEKELVILDLMMNEIHFYRIAIVNEYNS